MDIYVARQPIFKNDMSLFGYELLHRKSLENRYLAEDHNNATAELMRNSFVVMDFDNLTDGTFGFINFTQDLLKEGVPKLLPKEKVIIEILENVPATKKVIEACRKLKKEGYILALDDFILNRTDCDYTPLIEMADIIKVVFPVTEKKEQLRFLQKYKNKISFLAEKVETREQYKEAAEMGYELFQGYFFCKPIMMKSKEITSLNVHMIHIMKELQKEDPDFTEIAETIEKDLGLTYKLLRMVNTLYYGARDVIKDLRQAAVRLGIRELKQWISIMLIRDFENKENRELIKTCLLRGKLLALIAAEMNRENQETDFFLTGVLSSIDVIMEREMSEVISDLALPEEAENALLGEKVPLRYCLDTVIKYEKMEFDDVRVRLRTLGIKFARFEQMYIEALAWQRSSSKSELREKNN